MKRHERCSISGRCKPTVKYHYFHRFFTYLVKREARLSRLTILALNLGAWLHGDPHQRQCQAGSLTGAVHLSNGNAGVLRQAQRGQKPLVEQKGKSPLKFELSARATDSES